MRRSGLAVPKDFEIPSDRRVRRLRRPGMTQRAPRNRGIDPLGLVVRGASRRTLPPLGVAISSIYVDW